MTITDDKPFKVFLSCDAEYRDLEDSNFGLCLSCGADIYSCEPDAAGYVCPDCEEPKVYGIMHLLFNNRIVFESSSDSSIQDSSKQDIAKQDSSEKNYE